MVTPVLATCKSDRKFARLVLPLTILAVGLAGCSTVERQSFNVPQEQKVEAAYIATDADFGRYDRLYVEEAGIFFPQKSATPPEDTRRIRQIFRSAFIDELKHYRIVDSAGPSTMTVQASLIDFRNPDQNSLMGLRQELRDIAAKGELLFLMELRDSQSGRVLARAADSAKTPTFATAEGIETDWASVEDAARHWAELFRQFLDQNLGR